MVDALVASTETGDVIKLNTLKWGEALNDGFLLIPVVLLRKQKVLGLDSSEIVVLLNLLASWWNVQDMPYIQTSTIAARMGVSRRTVQRQIESLEKKGLIKRVWGVRQTEDSRAGAQYDLTGIVAVLKEHGRHGHPSRSNLKGVHDD